MWDIEAEAPFTLSSALLSTIRMLSSPQNITASRPFATMPFCRCQYSLLFLQLA